MHAEHARAAAPESVTLARVDAESQAVLTLLRDRLSEWEKTFGFGDPIEVDAAEYQPPNGLFVIACDAAEGKPLACGGYRTIARATVEITKMYVHPDQRRRGLGSMILNHLEAEARRASARVAVLETGSVNAAAASLYRSRGYRDEDPPGGRRLRMTKNL